MKTSKTRIDKRIKKKTNKDLVETLRLAKKSNEELYRILSLPARKKVEVNLDQINKESKEGETIIVPGKVLGKGEITKKIKIIAFSFTSSTLEKLKNSKTDVSFIKEELKKSKKIHGKILM